MVFLFLTFVAYEKETALNKSFFGVGGIVFYSAAVAPYL
jgi:hypothetical protein